MRISCAAPIATCRQTLTRDIKILGLQPIVTPLVVRAVYEGDDVNLVNTLLTLFDREVDHEITMDGDFPPKKRG